MATFENLKPAKFKLKSAEFIFKLVKLIAARHPVATLGVNWMLMLEASRGWTS